MAPNVILFPARLVTAAPRIKPSTPATLFSIQQLRLRVERQFAHRSKSRPWELLSAPAESPRYHRAG